MNISIAIVDKNREYLDRLVEVLQEYKELTVSMFTSAERLEQVLQTKKIDIVLFDPDVSEAKINLKGCGMGICLYSDEAQNMALYADAQKVLKYQRVSMMYKEILKLYAEEANISFDLGDSKRTKMLAVYSPIGGSGKTMISLAMASKLASYGKDVLYLSLEQLNSSCCVNPSVEDGVISLVEAVNENVNFELTIKGVMKKGLNGMLYIEGFERIVDYNTVTKEEAYNVLDKIRKGDICDILIVDMNSYIDTVSQAVFELADDIVIVEKPGALSEQKLNMFAQQALAMEYVHKMHLVTNFAEGNVAGNTGLAADRIGLVRNMGNQPVKTIVQAICSNNEIQLNSFLN